jgi:RNA recognition motif-containing protein
VREYFEKFGPVVSANLKYDFGQTPPKFRGFGFINFVEDESVEKALENYSNHQLGGKWIEVKRSKYSHVVQGENSGVIMPQMAQGSGSGRGGAYEGGRAAPAYKDPYGGVASAAATRDPYGGGAGSGQGSRYGGYQSSGPVGRSTGAGYRASPYGAPPTSSMPSNISYEARPLPRQSGSSAPTSYGSSSKASFDPYMTGTSSSAYAPKSGGWRSQQSINPPM